MKEEKNWKYSLCPYLGQRSDPGTALSYPSVLNRCYHTKPVVAINLGHQEEFCLTTNYPNCKEYAREPDAAPPIALHGSSESRSRKRPGNKKWVLGIVLLGLGLIVAWQFITRGEGFDQFFGGPTGITESTETSTESTSTFLSPTTTSTPTPTPTFVDTAISRPPLGLEIPRGIEHQFVIHRVLQGESLNLISNHYGTTVEAIQHVNYYFPIPLWVDSLIIIPVNQTDVSGIPAFEAYRVEKDIPAEELAQQLMVDPAVLKYYNDLKDGQVLTADEWVLVPHTGTATP